MTIPLTRRHLLTAALAAEPPATDLDRPFMLMTAEFTPGAEESNVAGFWPLLHGWRRQVHTCGATHDAYCDYRWLVPQLATSGGGPAPARAVRIQQAYPLAFFDLHLRHRRQPLLDGPSPAFPEVRFVA